MLIFDEPNLEARIERGVLLLQLLEMSKAVSVRFEDGYVEVAGQRFGTRKVDITNDVLQEAIKFGYGGRK